MADKILKKLKIKVWRQNNAKSKGKFETYTIENISTGSSFLEMMDILNNDLIEKMGYLIAQDMKILGMHLNFAPVVDINNNPIENVNISSESNVGATTNSNGFYSIEVKASNNVND